MLGRRRRLVCRGVVQGVGFRPAVHRLAAALHLGGFVRNDPEGATVDVEALALAGGCLVNRLLRRDLSREIAAVGLRPLLPRELPAGDGGLSFGQAVLAATSLARGVEPQQVGEGGA